MMNSSIRSLWPGTASCPSQQLLGAVGCQPSLTSGSEQEAPLAAQHRLLRQGHILLCRAHKKQHHLPFNTRYGEGDFWERPEVSQNVTFSHGFALVLVLQAGCQSCTDPALSWAEPLSQHSAVGPHPPVPVPHIPFTHGFMALSTCLSKWLQCSAVPV